MNGKASVLSEAARFVKDMLSQIKHMRTENTTLLSESQYVSVLISGNFAQLGDAAHFFSFLCPSKFEPGFT